MSLFILTISLSLVLFTSSFHMSLILFYFSRSYAAEKLDVILCELHHKAYTYISSTEKWMGSFVILVQKNTTLSGLAQNSSQLRH
ncbi:hypothetical protein F4810DRAFT_655572 [Camillea tinctor]|nr:hypothetical protein F4810DRAFT_655572 [Camillea tinctor]